MTDYASPFTGKSHMPFGDYKNWLLEEVPASHLLKVYADVIRYAPNKRSVAEKYLLDYIEKNKQALELKAQ
jgi:hypothetical protein